MQYNFVYALSFLEVYVKITDIFSNVTKAMVWPRYQQAEYFELIKSKMYENIKNKIKQSRIDEDTYSAEFFLM